MRRVLFLELSGFLSLGITLAIVAMLISMRFVETEMLQLPLAGLFLVFVFILLTIRYTRKDLHKIHELHSRAIYRVGRSVMYFLGAGMVVYGLYLLLSTADIWTEIGIVILADLAIVIGIFAIYYTFILGYLIKNEHLRHKSVTFSDLFLVVIMPIALVAVSIFMLFGKGATTIAQGKADFEIPASKIIAEFEAGESQANAKYHGKVLQFGGVISEISGDSTVLVKLNVGVDETTANCGFDKSLKQKLNRVAAGDSVIVKCSCSGYTRPDDAESMLSEKSLDLVRCDLVGHVPQKK